jgi:hypothetical protein
VGFPRGREQAAPLEAMQGGIQRTVFEPKHISAGLVDVAGDVMPVRAPAFERAQNQHVERALHE